MVTIRPGRPNAAAIRQLMAGEKMQRLLAERGDALAEACNDESSWGGYYSADASSSTRARTHVWTKGRYDGTNTHRAKRLIRNLGSARQ